MKSKKIWGLILVSFCLFIFSGCGTGTNKDSQSSPAEKVISEELHQAHCDLLAKANQDLAEINNEVRTLNELIRNRKEPLTEAHNAALDELVAKQTSINKRMHEIKDVQQEDWEKFKSTFETDLEELKSILADLLDDLK